MDINSLQQKVFEIFAKKSNLIIRLFLLVYLGITVFIFAGYFFYYNNPFLRPIIYELGRKFGQFAICLLGVVVLPGILGRFGIEIRITRIITLFRRQLGITVFLLSFAHYSFVRSLPSFYNGVMPLSNLATFELFSLFAIGILFVMFMTSNNLSVRKLGKWWKRLHRLVYLVLWLLVLHTALQRISMWSVFIFMFAALEIVSWIYHLAKTKTPINLPSN